MFGVVEKSFTFRVVIKLAVLTVSKFLIELGCLPSEGVGVSNGTAMLDGFLLSELHKFSA